MSLADLQSALGSMVVARASDHDSSIDPLGSLNSPNLSAEEREWLARLADSPGFQVTCKIQRWWRQTKLQMAVKLTLSALDDRGAELVNSYLDATPCASLFFLPEATGFLEFVTAATMGQPHVAEVARFERALLLARQAAVEASGLIRSHAELECSATQMIRPHPAADMVLFAASPELLLGSLLGGRPLPEAQIQKFPVLVAPGLSRLWRPATADEYRLFEYSRKGATKQGLTAVAPGAADALKELLNDGAFCEGQLRAASTVDATVAVGQNRWTPKPRRCL